MQLGVIPENFIERLVLMSGRAPTPLADTQLNFLMARTIMTAVRMQLFEALSEKPLTASKISATCNTHVVATTKFLKTLVHLGYLKHKREYFSLTTLSRKWILKNSVTTVYYKMLFQFVEWEFMSHYDEYLKSGNPIDIHQALKPDQWKLYQEAMYDLGKIASSDVAQRISIPLHAKNLLDLGGGYGCYAKALCRKYAFLEAEVIDLPMAFSSLENNPEEDREYKIVYTAADVRTHDLGEDCYDVIFMANLVHHLDEETNRALMKRIATALRQGGLYIVLDFLRKDEPKRGDHLGALMDLYFSITSKGGTFSIDQLRQWQTEAGLTINKVRWLRSVPHYGLLIARKV